MDFSNIPELELILSYSVGGVSVLAILIAVFRVITWLKNNTMDKALKGFVDSVTSKDITIDLTILAEKKLLEIKSELSEQVIKQAQIIQAQSAVLTDIADVISKSKLVSEAQFNSLQAHTKAIRTHEPAKPKETVKVKIEPLKKPETKSNYMGEL